MGCLIKIKPHKYWNVLGCLINVKPHKYWNVLGCLIIVKPQILERTELLDYC